MKIKPTKTINKIHFSDLNPMRFEDLCLNLIQRQKEWKEIRHYGRKGSDQGIDILGIDHNSNTWYFQCKRYFKISLAELKNIVEKIIELNKDIPNYLVIIVSCDISKNQHEKLIEFSLKKGINNTQIWSSSKIEALLYEKHHDLLFTYFGINLPNERKNNISKVKQALRMKKKFEKDFLRKDMDYDSIMTSIFVPHIKFLEGEIIIRNIENDTYPELDKPDSLTISNWFKAELYNVYHNGIEIYLSGESDLIYDIEGNWDIVTRRQNIERDINYKRIPIRAVGRISFSNIIEYDFGGDESSPMPHLFCKFDNDNTPYESIEYYSYADSKKKKAPYHFEKNKRKKLK